MSPEKEEEKRKKASSQKNEGRGEKIGSEISAREIKRKKMSLPGASHGKKKVDRTMPPRVEEETGEGEQWTLSFLEGPEEKREGKVGTSLLWKI